MSSDTEYDTEKFTQQDVMDLFDALVSDPIGPGAVKASDVLERIWERGFEAGLSDGGGRNPE